MSQLLSHIERFNRDSRSIHKLAVSSSVPLAGPFTRAVLSSDLGELARDIDPTELGLFTLIRPEPLEDRRREKKEISRVEFHGATPLRPGPQTAKKEKEIEPEVYLDAALRCIHRYSGVKPMKSAEKQAADLLDRLEQTRERINALTDELQQVENTHAPSMKPEADAEQARIDALKQRILKLEQKKADAISAQALSAPSPPTTPQKDEKSLYFGTPGPSAQTFHFTTDTEDLLNEDVHGGLGDVSTTFDAELSSVQDEESTLQPAAVDEAASEPAPVATPIVPPSVSVVPIQKEPSSSDTPKKGKLKVNPEVERITSKVWMCVGDLIQPGHDYDTAGQGNGKLRPPLAKETLAILKRVSSIPLQPNTLTSPPTSSASTAVPGIEDKNILTAYLVLSLIEANGQAMEVTRMKEVLADKIQTDLSTTRAPAISQGSKIIYGCQGKKLLKVAREGGKQYLKFSD
ncbi:hypothetical protein DL96DRAFT_1591980 [Flagelloscypha sp. PMI_526]|nr:hypothetical protein DL96DRAFT_1591980 [Flagelloscypha sp. PMI_526]